MTSSSMRHELIQIPEGYDPDVVLRSQKPVQVRIVLFVHLPPVLPYSVSMLPLCRERSAIFRIVGRFIFPTSVLRYTEKLVHNPGYLSAEHLIE